MLRFYNLVYYQFSLNFIIEEGADKYASRQGLFVLAQSGENVTISNDDQF